MPGVGVSAGVLACLGLLYTTILAAAQATLPSAAAMRASLGLRAGQAGFDAAADLNGDGAVNAQDIAWFLIARRDGALPSEESTAKRDGVVRAVPGRAARGDSATRGAEQIIVEPDTIVTLAGQTVTMLFLLRGNTHPFTSYTVDVAVVPQSGTGAIPTGTISANITATNFFDIRNVIAACPLSVCPTAPGLDPFFSNIRANDSGGVTVTAFSDDFTAVLAGDGVNDVLAQVVFDVPLDARGDFSIGLGALSALIDDAGQPIPFAFSPGTIRVLDPSVPTISEWGMIVMGVLIVAAGSVVLAKHGGAIGLTGGGWWPEDGGDARPDV